MTKPKEKFLFDDDLLEEMHHKREIEEKILAPKLMWSIFAPSGAMLHSSIEFLYQGAWYEFISKYLNTQEYWEKQGYQCRQITIKALKK